MINLSYEKPDEKLSEVQPRKLQVLGEGLELLRRRLSGHELVVTIQQRDQVVDET